MTAFETPLGLFQFKTMPPWKGHMTSLRQVLDRPRHAKSTAKSSKCMIVYGSIECLGHNFEGNLLGARMIEYRLSELPLDLQLRNRPNHS